MITGNKVENDIFQFAKRLGTLAEISGKVYLFGMRPRDSKKEDVVVKFVTGEDAQIESGIIAVNIYVPDIDFRNDGTFGCDRERCGQIESVAACWVNSLKTYVSNYIFSLSQTIYTEEDADINQHFIHVRLKYRHYVPERVCISNKKQKKQLKKT